MANMFNTFVSSSSKNGKKRATFDTRSATKCTCVAIKSGIFHNKFKDGIEETKFRMLFVAPAADGGTVSQWTPWMTASNGMFDERSNVMKLFDKNKDVVCPEHLGDPDWMFSQQWSVLGEKNKDYVNIKTVFHEEGKLENPQFYDLAAFPPFNTDKCFNEVGPITEMYVRLQDGTAHKVEDSEFKEWQDDGLPF